MSFLEQYFTLHALSKVNTTFYYNTPLLKYLYYWKIRFLFFYDITVYCIYLKWIEEKRSTPLVRSVRLICKPFSGAWWVIFWIQGLTLLIRRYLFLGVIRLYNNLKMVHLAYSFKNNKKLKFWLWNIKDTHRSFLELAFL